MFWLLTIVVVAAAVVVVVKLEGSIVHWCIAIKTAKVGLLLVLTSYIIVITSKVPVGMARLSWLVLCFSSSSGYSWSARLGDTTSTWTASDSALPVPRRSVTSSGMAQERQDDSLSTDVQDLYINSLSRQQGDGWCGWWWWWWYSVSCNEWVRDRPDNTTWLWHVPMSS